jgi:hypothetical protein
MDVFSFSEMGQGTDSCYTGGMYNQQNKIPAFLLFSGDDCSSLIFVGLFFRFGEKNSRLYS